MLSVAPRPPSLRVASVAAVAVLLLGGGCSVKKFAIRKLGDALSEAGSTYASDDDPNLIRGALPFSLKLIESLLAQVPEHRGLLLSAASGFTQYSYAFVQQDAEEKEDSDPGASQALREEARILYRRARDYGLRGLALSRPGFPGSLRADPGSALKAIPAGDVPFLYWTAASWGSLISLSKDDPDLLADLPLVEALVRRALELDEGYDNGALHEFLITFEGSRPDTMGGSAARAREHFARAMALSGGQRAAPLVALAESVAVRNQDRPEFESLLHKALAIDPDARPEWRLANLVMQRRARWLLERADLLFAD
jgi:predicted anti-sigma-YlaC factor YlaD